MNPKRFNPMVPVVEEFDVAYVMAQEKREREELPFQLQLCTVA